VERYEKIIYEYTGPDMLLIVILSCPNIPRAPKDGIGQAVLPIILSKFSPPEGASKDEVVGKLPRVTVLAVLLKCEVHSRSCGRLL
jgi:hypothetical protein